MTDDLDYLSHLRRESDRFAEVLCTAPADARVPTCPDWDAEDLLWHLGEVQWFWGEVVRGRVTENTQAEQLDPGERPKGREDLQRFYDQASADLARLLTETDPAMTLWTWATEQSAGFIRRRQAHEAFVHRLDAELTVGDRTPMDPALSADGVDEALRVMKGGVPAVGHDHPRPGSDAAPARHRHRRLVAGHAGPLHRDRPRGDRARRARHPHRGQRSGRRRARHRERLGRGPELLALAAADGVRPRARRRPGRHRRLRGDGRRRRGVTGC